MAIAKGRMSNWRLLPVQTLLSDLFESLCQIMTDGRRKWAIHSTNIYYIPSKKMLHEIIQMAVCVCCVCVCVCMCMSVCVLMLLENFL